MFMSFTDAFFSRYILSYSPLPFVYYSGHVIRTNGFPLLPRLLMPVLRS